jgi:hypothetical protein
LFWNAKDDARKWNLKALKAFAQSEVICLSNVVSAAKKKRKSFTPTPSSRGGTSKIELVVDYISTTENCNSHSLPCLSSSSCPSPADPTFDAVDASDPAQPIGLAILHAQKGIHIYKTRSVKGIKKKAFFSLPR